jgi:TonB family protein
MKGSSLLDKLHLRWFTLAAVLAASAVGARAQSPVVVTPPVQAVGIPPAQATTPQSQATTPPPPALPVARRPVGIGVAGRGPQVSRGGINSTGVIDTRDGQRLRLEGDLGSVRVLTDSVGSVRYEVHARSVGSKPDGRELKNGFVVRAERIGGGVMITGRARDDMRDQLTVTYEVHVPRTYNLEIVTHAGNIQVADIDGRVSLTTGGGNISVGSVNSGHQQGFQAAMLESSGGGHISIGDVVGDVHASTAGGHITVGNISGDATLETGGGHIHAGSIGGVAVLQTSGGNISVERAGGHVTASSGGGQINFGQAAGAIQAKTTGGGVRVLHVGGPMQLDSNAGSIYMTGIENPVHASTATGSITAWLAPSMKMAADSQLESASGDIVLYIPRKLQVTVQAAIDTKSGHRIIADPALPMKISYIRGESGKEEIGQCAINGGGEVVHLRAPQGNIQLRFEDQNFLRQQQMFEQATQQEIATQSQLIQSAIAQSFVQLNNGDRTFVFQMPTPAQAPAASTMPAQQFGVAPAPPAQPAPSVNVPPAETLWLKFGEYMSGGVTIDATEEAKLRVQQVRPIYPPVARQAGIEGTVSMRILINENGKVTRVEPLSGESILQQAAMRAVRQWQYRPYILNGRAVPVTAVVSFEFQMHAD